MYISTHTLAGTHPSTDVHVRIKNYSSGTKHGTCSSRCRPEALKFMKPLNPSTPEPLNP